MLKIEKELFQWEKGRYVIIDDKHPEILTVEFYNSKSKNTKEVLVEDGRARIPNEFLKTELPVVALACTQKDFRKQVVARETFKIFPRPKPEYYIDSDEDDPITPPKPDGPSVDIVFDGGVIL